jgi:hypothetical protein
MKQDENPLPATNNTPLSQLEELLGEQHIATSYDTRLRVNAFELSDEEKISIIREHFEGIMHTLGLDLTDDSLRDTPARVAKMYVSEIFAGLNPKNRPECRFLRISTSITKCWWRKTSAFIQIANIILFRLLARRILPTSPQGR